MSAYKEDSRELLEKRKIPRFPVQLPAQLGSDADESSICTDLSSEGVSIETSRPLHIGERVSVKVTITFGEPPLRMMGQVVWKQNTASNDSFGQPIYELGIRFLKSSNNPWKVPSTEEHESEEFDDTSFLNGVAYGQS